MITATKPFTPNLEDYQLQIAKMFKNNWFTNHGPFVSELEDKLKNYFNVPYFLLVTNGTISMQLAIKALELNGEIITTPFSYVATTSSIVWENCKPIFADINEDDLNINPNKIEALITNKTQAILATNVFGYPCDFSKLKNIAIKYNLKLIYDSAHTFGTIQNNKHIVANGDISSISFHATKLFHTIEGGGLFCKSEQLYNKLKLLRNFGHTSPHSFDGVGINAKMNEACAAMGLVNFKSIDPILERRKKQWMMYFNNIKNKSITLPRYSLNNLEYNYSYFSIVVETENLLLKIMDVLLNNGIQTRRYFYPSLNTLNYVEYHCCPVSESISKRIFCLPLYHQLDEKDQFRIIEILNKSY